MQRIYRNALRGLPETMDGAAPLQIPTEMPTLRDVTNVRAPRHAPIDVKTTIGRGSRLMGKTRQLPAPSILSFSCLHATRCDKQQFR